MIFTELKKYTIEEIKYEIETDNIDFITQQETVDGSQSITSGVWLECRRMLVREPNVLIDNYVWCMHCKNSLPYYNNTTTKIWEHLRKCQHKPFEESNANAPSTIKFKMNELQDLRNAAARFVVKDVRPFIAIEGEGLRGLIYAAVQLGKKYPQMTEEDLKKALPSRNTLIPIIQQEAVTGVGVLSRKLQHAITYTKRIAVTADMWTEPFNSTAFLGLTVHFFTIEEAAIKLETHTADLREINAPSMTGIVIKNAIIDILADYGVSQEEVEQYVCMVTDRGSNMLAAVNQMDCDSEVCVAHLCNNVVGHMIKVPEAKDIVNKASALVRYMKTSHASAEMTFKLKSFPETRFNYAYDMLKSISDNYNETFDVLSIKESTGRYNREVTDKITCLQPEKLKALCDFLVFFKNITTAIEGDKKVTLHRVWPTLREIRAKLQPNEMDDDLIAAMKNAGLTYIMKPDNNCHFMPSMRKKLALFLHPQMNRLPFLNFIGNIFVCGSLKSNFFRMFIFSQLTSIEKMEFHKQVKELLDSIPEPIPLVSVQTTASSSSSSRLSAPSTSTSARASLENSLFQDYFNNNVSTNIVYDELEHYVVVEISHVSQIYE